MDPVHLGKKLNDLENCPLGWVIIFGVDVQGTAKAAKRSNGVLRN